MSQKVKSKIGRPKVSKEKARSIYLTLRLSTEESAAIKKAIANSGKKRADWIRAVLLRGASGG